VDTSSFKGGFGLGNNVVESLTVLDSGISFDIGDVFHVESWLVVWNLAFVSEV